MFDLLEGLKVRIPPNGRSFHQIRLLCYNQIFPAFAFPPPPLIGSKCVRHCNSYTVRVVSFGRQQQPISGVAITVY